MQAEFVMCMLLLAGSGDVKVTLFWKMDSRGPSRMVTLISETLRGNSQAAEVWPGIVNAANFAVSAREHDLHSDLSGADKHLTFFTGALEFANSPHARCPEYAVPHGIRNRMPVWR